MGQLPFNLTLPTCWQPIAAGKFGFGCVVLLLLLTNAAFVCAQSQAVPAPPPADRQETEKKSDADQPEAAADDVAGKSAVASKNQLIQKGVLAFKRYCVECHDAKRSLQEDKSLEQWRETVLRMSKMDDADIPKDAHEPIAVYLASLGTGGDQTKSQPSTKDAPTSKSNDDKLDKALIERGKQQFTQYCISCHDAEKSLQVSKSLADWRSTVVRMAGKDGANIPSSTHDAIATYLTSLSSGDKKDGSSKNIATTPSLSGTVSPWYRGGGDTNIQYPGFFGDVWIGASVQTASPVSLRATTCNTCHEIGSQFGRFDLVEATIKYDLTKHWDDKACGPCPVSASVQAGRFVVPFGAYYQQVNPGVDRAVTRPLIYNMGQRVYADQIGAQVLPMPYSDEGVSFNASMPFAESFSTTIDAYAVNGLEGGNNGVDFFKSRDYFDNNRTPSLGGRFTIGNKYLRLGSSLLGGRFNTDAGTGPQNQGLNNTIFGLDATFTYQDLFRAQAEFAQRDSDRFGNLPQGPTIFRERFSGGYLQSEVLLSRRWKISSFSRYDSQWTHSDLPPVGSRLTSGDFRVQRVTYGLNWTLPGGSLMMVNLENWRMPEPLHNVNVLGLRWAASF